MGSTTQKPRRAVPGRLYRDATGGFWIGGEDGGYWQTRQAATVLTGAGHRIGDRAPRIHRAPITADTPRTTQVLSRQSPHKE